MDDGSCSLMTITASSMPSGWNRPEASLRNAGVSVAGDTLEGRFGRMFLNPSKVDTLFFPWVLFDGELPSAGKSKSSFSSSEDPSSNTKLKSVHGSNSLVARAEAELFNELPAPCSNNISFSFNSSSVA